MAVFLFCFVGDDICLLSFAFACSGYEQIKAYIKTSFSNMTQSLKKPVGVGLVGAGWMGARLLAHFVDREDVKVIGLHQRNQERAEASLAAHALDPVIYCDSYEALLALPELDAVVICSPNALHGPQVIAAQEAGKHVFCEKPASTSYADYQRQIELELANPDLVNMVDYILHFDAFEQRLAHLIKLGAFGAITQVQVNYRHAINTAGEKAWKLDEAQVGDAIGMGVIHALSMMVSMMAPQGQPAWVFADSQPGRSKEFGVDPIWSIQVGFDQGTQGFCFGNIDHSNGYDAYHAVHGTDGALVFDPGQARARKVRYWSKVHTEGEWVFPLDPARCEAEGAEAWPEETTTPDSGDVLAHPSRAAVDHFIDCIQKGEPSFLSFARTAMIAEVSWAAQLSAQIGQRIALPVIPDIAEEFLG